MPTIKAYPLVNREDKPDGLLASHKLTKLICSDQFKRTRWLACKPQIKNLICSEHFDIGHSIHLKNIFHIVDFWLYI